jgi:GTP diphosphokinase / guanosine-3',5'-bis(diphosphate) 3'-diphosphatase
MLSVERRKRISSSYNRLVEVSQDFLKKDDLKLINRAFEMALKSEMGKDQLEPMLDIEHCIEVAIIAVGKIGLGATSIVSCLLHNQVDSKNFNYEKIEKDFGKNAASIIHGFNKISGINTKKLSHQSENFRRLFLSLVEDVRVVLIKLAHRLFDLRNLDHYDAERQQTIISEVNFIYIPIAHRLGLYNLKAELEELIMQHEHPDVFNDISNKLKATKAKRKVFIQEFTDPIRRELIMHGFDCEIKGRPKSIHSIWTKMKKQNVEFEEVFDLFAIRIISNSKQKNEKSDCWKIYSIVTDLYQPNPKRLRDWISTPKASGYESLHTTVKAQSDRWVEVQIRTKSMDEIAEKGQASHWRYKGFGDKKDGETYIQQIRDILENPNQIDFDLVASSKNNGKDDKVYIFTPGGDLKKLSVGSTVLDFAYEVHTDIGDHCTGALVNERNVPIRYVLNNGDRVEIQTAKNQSPKMDWLGFVTTSKAKNKIKRSFLEEKFKEAEAGNEILRRKFRTWKLDFNEENIDKLLRFYKFKSSIDLYYNIAIEKLDLMKVKEVLTTEVEKKPVQPVKSLPKEKTKSEEEKTDSEALLIDDRIKDVNYSLAKCCKPVWGDPVFGFVSIGKGIVIHRLNCPNATNLISKYDYRIIDVNWKSREEDTWYQSGIVVKGEDRVGIIGEIANVISNDFKVNMISINVKTRNTMFHGDIRVQVHDRDHLKELLKKLGNVEGVHSATRNQH